LQTTLYGEVMQYMSIARHVASYRGGFNLINTTDYWFLGIPL